MRKLSQYVAQLMPERQRGHWELIKHYAILKVGESGAKHFPLITLKNVHHMLLRSDLHASISCSRASGRRGKGYCYYFMVLHGLMHDNQSNLLSFKQKRILQMQVMWKDTYILV